MSASSPGEIIIHRGRSTPPRLPSRTTIERARLRTVLDLLLANTCDTQVVSITAPAGSGKTVLLSSWISRVTALTDTTVAWLTIDSSDNDVDVLLAAIKTALSASIGDPEVARLAQEVPRPGSADHSSIGARIGEALHAAGPVCLVLDDAHLLHESVALG